MNVEKIQDRVVLITDKCGTYKALLFEIHSYPAIGGDRDFIMKYPKGTTYFPLINHQYMKVHGIEEEVFNLPESMFREVAVFEDEVNVAEKESDNVLDIHSTNDFDLLSEEWLNAFPSENKALALSHMKSIYRLDKDEALSSMRKSIEEFREKQSSAKQPIEIKENGGMTVREIISEYGLDGR